MNEAYYARLSLNEPRIKSLCFIGYFSELIAITSLPNALTFLTIMATTPPNPEYLLGFEILIKHKEAIR